MGGDSKIPFCEPGDETYPEFLDRKKEVSFVGRPFPVEDAESHFKRLKKAGMLYLRFVVTWEALEHEGPGIYDEAYLAYLRKILIAAENEGISVFIDPHQDVWSRWTGGDGAPAWTMEKLGMDLGLMDACGAAVTRQRYAQYHEGKPFPKMLWPGNYNRYAAATMLSLFFAGLTYAPDLLIDGENVQDWLQNKYIAAFCHAQRRLKNCPAIFGWGVINEPQDGFIGYQNLARTERSVIPTGPRPSPWQAIMAANGHSVKVPVYALYGMAVSHYEIFNKDCVPLFKEGFSCPWKQAGIWQEENGKPVLKKPDHFKIYNGRCPAFAEDFLKPFTIKYINAMKEADEKKFFFIEGMPEILKEESHPDWNENDPINAVNAFHWYDGLSLFTKSFRSWMTIHRETYMPIFGEKNVTASFAKCLAKGIRWTKKKMRNIPCLLGEFGLAFDLNDKVGFKTGNYSLHEKALSMYYDAVDANMLHSTLWNYSAGNTNKYGDNWNDEDLSIFSQGSERAAAGWKRPYPIATAGKLVSYIYDTKHKKFIFRYEADKSIKAPTIIYLPEQFFGSSPKIKISGTHSGGISARYNSEEQQVLIYNDDYSGETEIIITAAV